MSCHFLKQLEGTTVSIWQEQCNSWSKDPGNVADPEKVCPRTGGWMTEAHLVSPAHIFFFFFGKTVMFLFPFKKFKERFLECLPSFSKIKGELSTGKAREISRFLYLGFNAPSTTS